MKAQAHFPVHTAPGGYVFFFFRGAWRPQKPYGLLGTGKEWGKEGMRAQTHLPLHTVPELWSAANPQLWWKTNIHVCFCFRCVLLLVQSKQIKNATNTYIRFYVLRFWGHIHKATKFDHVGIMGTVFIYILNTVSFSVFMETIKHIMKFTSYLTTVTNRTYSFVPWNT